MNQNPSTIIETPGAVGEFAHCDPSSSGGSERREFRMRLVSSAGTRTEADPDHARAGRLARYDFDSGPDIQTEPSLTHTRSKHSSGSGICSAPSLHARCKQALGQIGGRERFEQPLIDDKPCHHWPTRHAALQSRQIDYASVIGTQGSLPSGAPPGSGNATTRRSSVDAAMESTQRATVQRDHGDCKCPKAPAV
jgi:hypothetical protein